MTSSSPRVEAGAVDLNVSTNAPSKLKTYGFAIVIILGLGGLAVAGVGLGGYLQAGSLSSLGQVNSMIMMVAGGGGGIILLIIGIVGSVKNRQIRGHQQNDHNESTEPNRGVNSKNTEAIETHDGLIYGKDAWKIWNVEVVDDVPEVPNISWEKKDPFFKKAFKKNYVLLYIPKTIRVNGEVKNLTLKTFKEISGGPFEYFQEFIADWFEDSTPPGWVLISKKIIPDSREKDYLIQKEMVEAQTGFQMPHVLEAVVLNLMENAFTRKKLYGNNPITYTRCIECRTTLDCEYPVIVGGFGSAGLDVRLSRARIGFRDQKWGAACALRGFLNASTEPNRGVNSKNTEAIETHGGLIYGKDAWKIWNVEVVDDVPEVPNISWEKKDPYFKEAFKKNYVLLYIPKTIRVNGEVKNLTLTTFKEISGGPFDYFQKGIADKFDDSTPPGWVLISKKIIPHSREKDYLTQKEMVEAQTDFQMPHVLEAVVLNLMENAFTRKKLYGDNPITYTRCIECRTTNDAIFPVAVGGFGSAGLDVEYSRSDVGREEWGAACALREFLSC